MTFQHGCPYHWIPPGGMYFLNISITSTLTGQSPIQTVPACPVQIRAHHHIDVYADINNNTFSQMPIDHFGIEIQILTI